MNNNYTISLYLLNDQRHTEQFFPEPLTLPSLPLTRINPYLNQVVKVVLPSYPAVVGLQTVGLIGNVFRVQTFTVVELPFE